VRISRWAAGGLGLAAPDGGNVSGSVGDPSCDAHDLNPSYDCYGVELFVVGMRSPDRENG
jgi:hypothetical protein